MYQLIVSGSVWDEYSDELIAHAAAFNLRLIGWRNVTVNFKGGV